ATNFCFADAGTIHNAQEYAVFLSRVEAYAIAMPQIHARIAEYVLQPFSTVPHYPNYLALLYPYSPPSVVSADYDSFLHTYTELQAWKQKFDRFILNGDSLSWLNSQGRQIVQNSWLGAANY